MSWIDRYFNSGPTGPTGPAGASAFATQATATSAKAIQAGWDQPFNSYAGGFALTTPASAVDGTVFRARDIGNAVQTYTVTMTDQNGYLIQNPVDGGLYTTITWGPGSGGTANPDLQGLSSFAWARVTVTKGAVTTTFWQAIGQ